MPERACTHRHMWMSGFCEDCGGQHTVTGMSQVGCVLVGD